MSSYTRLSALDRSFLDIEERSTHMHVGATCIFEAGPLTTPEGGIDITLIREHVQSRLHKIPRYRQRLAWIPLENHPVWVDDDQFNLNYHVRHASLPRPGGERQLKRLSGRVFSQQLDRGKPLWEMWVVEGLDHDRFAIINKVHHCMVDGIAGADLLTALLGLEPSDTAEPSHPWYPSKAPDQATLLRDAAVHRVAAPVRGMLRLGLRAASEPREFVESLRDTALTLSDTISGLTKTSTPSPINEDIGPHRRFDWSPMSLDTLRTIKNREGTKLNDVVLTIVSGAIDRFFEHRGFRPQDVEDFQFRIFCPVGLSSASGGSRMGNRVSAMSIEAPLGEKDPLKKLALIKEQTAEAKSSRQSEGVQMIEEFADWAAPWMVGALDELAAKALSFGMVCTNVPGPGVPLYMLGSRMQSSYPLVPLFKRQGIGIALMSYNGQLNWGFSADREVMPDLHYFMESIDECFRELKEAAGVDTPRAEKQPPPEATPEHPPSSSSTVH
jgi:diacylglycerol O-acyltransferase